MYEINDNNEIPKNPEKYTSSYFAMNDNEFIYDSKYGKLFFKIKFKESYINYMPIMIYN